MPANHWQAEDRAHRIGQTRPVNVYYFAAAGTIEEFMGQVLEAKSRLIRDVVEGGSLTEGGDASADLLSELQRVIHRVSSQMAKEAPGDRGSVDRLLREAVRLYGMEVRDADFYKDPRGGGERPTSVVTPEAIDALARALNPPVPICYQVRSSRADEWYTLEVDGSDVACSCRGFHYRGQCRHATKLKAALAAGGAVPDEFRPLEGGPRGSGAAQ